VCEVLSAGCIKAICTFLKLGGIVERPLAFEVVDSPEKLLVGELDQPLQGQCSETFQGELIVGPIQRILRHKELS
jgi:hypothetical protein